MIRRISQNQVEKVVVLYRDRLLRFGFELIEYIASLYNCEIEIIDNPDDFTGAVSFVEDLEKHSMVLYSLSSYDNLVKSGRMPRVAGQVASMLSIRILGTASDEGTIQVVGPTRGEKKTYRKICDTMASDGYAGGLVYIDHVLNEDCARDLAKAIVNTWPNADVHVLPCRGLCSHYAEPSGLIIGYEWQNR